MCGTCREGMGDEQSCAVLKLDLVHCHAGCGVLVEVLVMWDGTRCGARVTKCEVKMTKCGVKMTKWGVKMTKCGVTAMKAIMRFAFVSKMGV